MPPFLCKVKTASDATVVQIVERQGRVDRVLKHLGFAHDDATLVVLLEKGHRELYPGQLKFDLFDTGSSSTSCVGGICRKTVVTLRRDSYYKYQRNFDFSQ